MLPTVMFCTIEPRPMLLRCGRSTTIHCPAGPPHTNELKRLDHRLVRSPRSQAHRQRLHDIRPIVRSRRRRFYTNEPEPHRMPSDVRAAPQRFAISAYSHSCRRTRHKRTQAAGIRSAMHVCPPWTQRTNEPERPGPKRPPITRRPRCIGSGCSGCGSWPSFRTRGGQLSARTNPRTISGHRPHRRYCVGTRPLILVVHDTNEPKRTGHWTWQGRRRPAIKTGCGT